MKRSSLLRSGLGLGFIFLLVTACDPPNVAGTDVPRVSITRTAAPISRTWDAQPILIELFTSAGYTSEEVAWSNMPDFVLYADGRVMVTRSDYIESQYKIKRTVVEGHLTSTEVCALLNQIEADGFFDMNEADYHAPGVTDMGTTDISVNAWRVQSISAYALGYATYGPKSGAKVPTALATIYERLNDYQPTNGQPYQPERIALHISLEQGTSIAAHLWPLAQPTIRDLLSRGDENGTVIVEGQEARELYTLWNNDLGRTYAENNQIYQIVLRPLLPLEQYPLSTGWWPPPLFPVTPTVQLSCDSAPSTPWPTLRTERAVLPTPTPNPALEIEAPLKYITSLGRHDQPGQLNSPSSLAFGPHGEIIVGDLLNDRFEWYSPEGLLLHETIITPTDISIWDFRRMADGRWYVLGQNRVDILSPDGQLLQTFKGWPEPKTDIPWSTELAVGPDGTMYIAESWGRRVVILNPDGTLKEIWTGPDNSPLNDVRSLDVDIHGNLYVASGDPDRIVKRTPSNQITEFQVSYVTIIRAMPDESFYTMHGWTTINHYAADGTLLQEWTDKRLENSYPRDIIGLWDGTVVVLSEPEEKNGPAVFRYDPTGQPLAAFGDLSPRPGQFRSHYTFSASPAGDVWLVEKDDGSNSRKGPRTPTRLVHLSGNNQHLGTFATVQDQPFTCSQYALAALTDQTVFLADPCAGRIQHMDADGQVIAQWGQRGAEAGQFSVIRDLTLAPDEKSLYVVDEGKGQIGRFSLAGELMRTWSTQDWNTASPIGLAVDPEGTFYLIDGVSNEIVVHSAQGASRRWILPNSEDAVNSIAIDAWRQRIYVGGAYSRLYAFDQDGRYLGQVNIGKDIMLETMADGHLLSSTGDDSIAVYEPK